MFNESCSRYVYRVTSQDGFIAGIGALRLGMRSCCAGTHVVRHPIDKGVILLTTDRVVVPQEELADWLLKMYNQNDV